MDSFKRGLLSSFACAASLPLLFAAACPGAMADYPTYPNYPRRLPQLSPQQKKTLIRPAPVIEQPQAEDEDDDETPKLQPARRVEPIRSQPAASPKPLEPEEFETSGKSAAGFKLQAGIAHSEYLAPVPETQRPGKIFRSAIVKPAARAANRFRVPEWLAGVWQRMEASEISRTELPSGKKLRPAGNQIARVRDVFGSYRDAKGQVWQLFNPLKAAGQVDRGASMDYHNVHGYDLVITGPRSAAVKVRASHTLVSKANRRISKVYQDEELNKYSLLSDGRLQTDSSVKVFDMDGKPFLLTRTMSSELRIPPKNWPPRVNSLMPRN